MHSCSESTDSSVVGTGAQRHLLVSWRSKRPPPPSYSLPGFLLLFRTETVSDPLPHTAGQSLTDEGFYLFSLCCFCQMICDLFFFGFPVILLGCFFFFCLNFFPSVLSSLFLLIMSFDCLPSAFPGLGGTVDGDGGRGGWDLNVCNMELVENDAGSFIL